jgi:hypothetical protein
MKIKINTLAIRHKLFRDWANNSLSWREEEWPFTTSVFNKDSHESFNRSENSSVDHDWSLVTWFHMLLKPSEIFTIKCISFESL